MKRVVILFLFVLPLIGNAQLAIDDGLVAYYPFTDGSWSDFSQNSLNLEQVGQKGPDATPDRFGVAGHAMKFGSTGRAQLAAPNDTLFNFGRNPFTVSLWFAGVNDNPSDAFVVAKYDTGAQNAFGLALSRGRAIGFVVSQHPAAAVIANTDFAPEWHMFTMTVDSQNITYFMDGDLLHKEGIENENHTIENDYPIYIGGLPDAQGYNGDLDDIRIYNRALSASEIAGLYEYESQPQSSSRIRGALVRAQVINGFLVGAEVIDGGYGYTSSPTVTINGGGGLGAVAKAIVGGGKVVKINIENPGNGYTSSPTIDIAPPPLPVVAASATAKVVNGFIVSTTIIDGGYGYNQPPAVTLIDDTGQGAIVTAEVTDGRVVALNVVNPGSGYSENPIISIAPPPNKPVVSIRVTQVEVNMKLTVGRRYKIESSNNMVDWTQFGDVFTAEEEFIDFKFDTDEFGKFFRVTEQP